jgi:hypothetical protein
MSFEDVMNMAAETAIRPPPFPNGTYRFLILKHTPGAAQNEKKTPLIELELKPIAALADVDQSRLPEDWNNRLQNYSFFMTKDAAYRLREFAEAMGVQVTGRTFKQIVPDLQGKYCTGTIVAQPSKRRPSEIVSFITELGPDRT